MALVNRNIGIYNLQQLYRLADGMDRHLGNHYYQEMHNRIWRMGRDYCPVYGANNNFSRSLHVSCGVYAALSPNNSQESCMEDAARALSRLPGAMDAFNERWSSLVVHTYDANKDKARRILLGEDPDVVLKGIKTNNFYHNLLDPQGSGGHVTIDGHMVNAWNNQRMPLDTAKITIRDYNLVADGVREVSKEVFKGRISPPSQLQAILWLTWRRINKIPYNPQYELEFQPLEEESVNDSSQ